MQIWNLDTSYYGITSCLFQSCRVIKQLAKDYKDEFALGAETLDSEIHVDDVAAGAYSLKKAISKQK